MQVFNGMWGWHVNAHNVVQIQHVHPLGQNETRVTVTVTHHSLGAYGAWVDGREYETYADCIVSLDLAPAHIREYLGAWDDAIAEDWQRNAQNEEVTDQQFYVHDRKAFNDKLAKIRAKVAEKRQAREAAYRAIRAAGVPARAALESARSPRAEDYVRFWSFWMHTDEVMESALSCMAQAVHTEQYTVECFIGHSVVKADNIRDLWYAVYAYVRGFRGNVE